MLDSFLNDDFAGNCDVHPDGDRIITMLEDDGQEADPVAGDPGRARLDPNLGS